MRSLRPWLFLCALVLPGLASAAVTVKEAWVRGTVPAQKSTAAYMTITSSETARLVGISTPAAKRAQIHASMVMAGVSHMHEIEVLDLPAGKAVQLKPGGHHVMLLELAKPMAAGEKVPLVLTVEDVKGKRSQVKVEAEVRPLGQ
jgi:periplasmic copper chaperone A